MKVVAAGVAVFSLLVLGSAGAGMLVCFESLRSSGSVASIVSFAEELLAWDSQWLHDVAFGRGGAVYAIVTELQSCMISV